MNLFRTRLAPALVMLAFLVTALPQPAHALVGLGVPTMEFGPKEWIVDVAGWVTADKMRQVMVKDIINIVVGKNGAEPQFITDLSFHFQRLADSQAQPFLSNLNVQLQNSGSPFASAITAAVGRNYLQSTSLAGFYAANQCSLTKSVDKGGLGLSTAQVNSFLGGQFDKGGWATWFSLTTRSENNPYLLYQNTQDTLASVINSTNADRQQELSWGQGFLSTCDSAATALGWDTCTNSDGSSLITKTPGVLLKDELSKAVGSNIDRIVQADEFDEMLGSAISQLSSKILDSSLGGLLGSASVSYSSGSSGSGRSLVDTFANESDTNNPNYQSTAQNSVDYAQSVIDGVTTWKNNWTAINARATAASTAIASLLTAANKHLKQGYTLTSTPCWTDNTNTLISDATAAANTAALIQKNAQDAFATADQTIALAEKVKAEANSTDATAAANLQKDTAALNTAPPTGDQSQQAAQDAQITGAATASPTGSLAGVSGGTMIDRMSLLEKNATAAMSCTDVPAAQI